MLAEPGAAEAGAWRCMLRRCGHAAAAQLRLYGCWLRFGSVVKKLRPLLHRLELELPPGAACTALDASPAQQMLPYFATGLEASVFMHPQHLHLTIAMLKLYRQASCCIPAQ